MSTERLSVPLRFTARGFHFALWVSAATSRTGWETQEHLSYRFDSIQQYICPISGTEIANKAFNGGKTFVIRIIKALDKIISKQKWISTV